MREPRWAKTGRDLTTHKLRTLLVVLSIGIGVFAIITVFGGRGILIESFDTNFGRSQPSNAALYTTPFDESVPRRVATVPGVRYAEGRLRADLRYRLGDLRAVADPHAGTVESNRPAGIELVAARDWAASQVELVFPDEGVRWPPAPDEVVLERSATQIVGLKTGDLITIPTTSGEKRVLRVAGFAHDINAFPAMFTDQIRGYV